VVFFEGGKDLEKPIQQIERIVGEMDTKDFGIHLAGAPYVVEQMRHGLSHDFRYFSLMAVLIFGLTMAVMFRSWRIFLGMLATCASAVLLTLLLQWLFGQRIGVLTVNLGTIVFVVTLSHLIYMTFNWQTLTTRLGGNKCFRGRLCHRCALGFSTYSTLRTCCARGNSRRYSGQSLCPAPPGWRGMEESRSLTNTGREKESSPGGWRQGFAPPRLTR